MFDVNTTRNIFRFNQLRPPKGLQKGGLELDGASEFAQELAATPKAQRRKKADAFLANARLDQQLQAPLVKAVLEAFAQVAQAGGTVEDFRRKVFHQHEEETARGDILHARRKASDALLATKFTARPTPSADDLLCSFIGCSLLLPMPQEAIRQRRLTEVARTAVGLPAAFDPRLDEKSETEISAALEEARRRAKQARDEQLEISRQGQRLQTTLRELLSLGRREYLDTASTERAQAQAAPLTLNRLGLAALSGPALAELEALGLPVESMPLHALVQAVAEHVEGHAQRAATALALTSATAPLDIPVRTVGKARLRPAGVTDLLVVKQQLERYERTDIAHVENVMAGELRTRTHRALERIEETLTEERDTRTERETELETAERFEMNRETQQTATSDQQLGFGLSVSGKYGPSVEFSSNAEAQLGSSTSQSETSATNYAKDIVERSLERVAERVREERIRRVIREEEEKNRHRLENTGQEHVSGVYQFLEKVYQSQVFDYGIRQVFDFVIPEPASYVWSLEGAVQSLELPAPPEAFDKLVPDATSIDASNYRRLAAHFGATGVEPPSPIFRRVATSIKPEMTNGGEGGKPRKVLEGSVSVPAGYAPYSATVNVLAMTDDEVSIGVSIGSEQMTWIRNTGFTVDDIGGGHSLTSGPAFVSFLSAASYDPQSKLPIQVLAYETNTFCVLVDVLFQQTSDAYAAWQLRTYAELLDAHRDRVQRYEQEVRDLRARAEKQAMEARPRFGAPPSRNAKNVRAELKKHCISILTRQRYDDLMAMAVGPAGPPPFFDFDLAEAEGSFIRFFEQAFEWDQVQYVFYPYYWARKSEWDARYLRSEVDPAFLDFLQAGAARAVVPVRPGFEAAVCHFLETGNIWNGLGDPPRVNSSLYLPILTEIQERTGAPQGEIAVGKPWETRVPTPLVILRSEKSLPAWERVAPNEWRWREVGGG